MLCFFDVAGTGHAGDGGEGAPREGELRASSETCTASFEQCSHNMVRSTAVGEAGFIFCVGFLMFEGRVILGTGVRVRHGERRALINVKLAPLHLDSVLMIW